MSKANAERTVSHLAIALVLIFLGGCAGLEYAPKEGMFFYHKELPAAERAVEAARSAGKDRECPDKFKAAEKAKNDAYDIYWACRTAEAIAKANEAAALANALCPKRVEAPPPPPAPAPAPAPLRPAPAAPPPVPSVAISASPSAIERGECTNLMWSSVDVAQASIDQGFGSVTPDGTRRVCPTTTTTYTIAASGPGGTKKASTTVTVTVPPPPPPSPAPAPRVIERLRIRINFDFDKADIRQADVVELQKAVDFVKRHPQHKISIEGHTDGLGGEVYNQKLSERRAMAVRDYLVANAGADPGRMSTVGYGKSRPIADNRTREGRLENRRVELIATTE